MALFAGVPDYAHIIWMPQQFPEGESGVTGLMSGLGAGMGAGGGAGGMSGMIGGLGGGGKGGGGGGGGGSPPVVIPPAVASPPEQRAPLTTEHWGYVGRSAAPSGSSTGQPLATAIDDMWGRAQQYIKSIMGG